jgi:hemoglobin/transferrin/lactoferrin receptor protein
MKIKIFLLIIFYLFNFKSIAQKTDSIEIEEVIISANKTSERVNRVAQQIGVISAKTITFQQAQSTADLLQSSGMAFVQKSQQGGGSPILRGFEANKILLVIDGVKMNNAIYRGGHLQNVITIDNNALSRVEVLFGPSSTMYGSDALGGVLHFYTKKPVFSTEANTAYNGGAMTRFSTVNNEKTANVNFNFGRKKLASFTSVTASSFGDLSMGKRINPALGRPFGERLFYVERINGKDSIVANPNKYKQVSSGFDQLDIVQKISHQLSNNIIQSLNFQLSTSTDIPRYDRLTDPSSSTTFNQAQWNYGPQKRTLIAYDINKSDPEISKANIHLGINYQAIEESRVNRRFGSSNLNNRIENISVLGVNFDVNKKVGKNSIRYGLDAQFNDLKSTAYVLNIKTNLSSPLDTRYPDGKNKYSQVGAYFSHSADITEKFIINDGLRVGFTTLNSTFINKDFFPFPFDEAKQSNFTYSANVGLNYLIGQKSKISANIASGFRAPNIDDLAKVFEATPNTIIVPNTKIKPEQTISFDLGTNLELGRTTSIQIVMYHTQLFDAIVVDKFTFNGKSEIDYDGSLRMVMANQNKRQATINGISVIFKSQLTKTILFDASTIYTKGTIKDDNNTPLDHIPPMVLKSGFTYTTNKLNTGITLLYNSWKRIKNYNPSGEDNQQYAPAEGMPSWYTLNLKSSYTFSKNLTILASIDNIMDLQYRAFASGINAGGRNYSITLKVWF